MSKVDPAAIRMAAQRKLTQEADFDEHEFPKVKNPKEWVILKDIAVSLPGSGPQLVRRGQHIYDAATKRLMEEAGVAIKAYA